MTVSPLERAPMATVAPALRIDLDAVTANVRAIRARTAGEVMAVVKADGFGHGTADVASAALAGGATRLGVTSIEEALALRRAGFPERVLSWLNPVGADFARAAAHGIELAAPSREHLAAIAAGSLRARVHLQLDTGLARDGAAPEEWAALCRAARVAELAGVVEVAGIMGHLPASATVTKVRCSNAYQASETLMPKAIDRIEHRDLRREGRRGCLAVCPVGRDPDGDLGT